MTEFALIDGAGSVLRYERHDVQPGDMPAKGWRWLPVTRASFDATYEVHVPPSEPIASDATSITWGKAYKPLADVLAARLAALATYRYDREVAGITVGEYAILTDRESQGLVDSLQRSLADEVISSVNFKAASGQIVACNLALATAIRNAVVLHVQGCRNAECAHAIALAELETAAEVAAYDITADWPASGVP